MGIDFVFNTPNSKSRPGYLKMGWGEVGRVPVAVRIAGLRHVRSVVSARSAAEKWSEPTDVGASPSDAFADDGQVSRLIEAARTNRLSTDRTAAYLRWRYSFAPLHYRVIEAGGGLITFRLRRRGGALEATVTEVLGVGASDLRRAVADLLRRTGADYAITSGGRGLRADGFVPAPLGPTLTWKPITRIGVPRLTDLDLGLGDVELF